MASAASPTPLGSTPGADPAYDDARLARATELAAHAPPLARVGRVRTGTAGWTDPSLIKSQRFYPRSARSAEQRLRYYASQFSLVEVDSSYYALPSATNARLWAERTGPDFVFNIKAFAPLTQHPVEPSRLPPDLGDELPDELKARRRLYPKDLPPGMLDALFHRFRDAIEPLRAAGKLGCVLLQFPPWFTATRGNARQIEACRARLADLAVAVELRHASWGAPERFDHVIALLRSLRAAYVIVDEPQGKPNSMPPAVRVADPSLAVVRFHGRRAETWDARVSVQEKFDYLYDPSELEPWAAAIERVAGQAEQVHVIFNNCVSNHAVLGAKGLAAQLSTRLGAVPPQPPSDQGAARPEAQAP